MTLIGGLTLEKEVNNSEQNMPPFKSELFDWGEALVISLTAVVIIFIFFIRLIAVDGSSMVPTLHDKDKLLISNLFYTPQKGDIVVLTKDSFMPDPIVKRVIATEGQIVDIDFDAGEVYVDNELMLESYINEPTFNRMSMTFPAVVPEGCVFVLGDNRNHSTDSRDTRLGMVDTRYILGRVIFRFYPTNVFGTVK